MELKKVVSGMYIEFADGRTENISNWNVHTHDNESVAILELVDGTEIKIVTEFVTADLSKRREYE